MTLDLEPPAVPEIFGQLSPVQVKADSPVQVSADFTCTPEGSSPVRVKHNKTEAEESQYVGSASVSSIDTTDRKSVPPPPPPPPSLGSQSAKKAEEDEELHPLSIESSRYAAFKNLYPAKRFDEAKAKPSFEGLSQSEQDLVIARLPVFAACEQWIRNPRFIPFASNFVKRAEYQSDPPPVLNVAASEPAPSRKDREIRGRIARAALEDLKRGRHG